MYIYSYALSDSTQIPRHLSWSPNACDEKQDKPAQVGMVGTHLQPHLPPRLKQEDCKFEASLEHTVRLSQNKEEKEKAHSTRCSRKLIWGP